MDAVRLIRLCQSPRALVTQVAADTGGVGEQHPQGYLVAPRIVGGVEVGQICLHGFIDLNPAPFVQLQYGHARGQGFGQRRDVEDRVVGHWLGRCR
ncbi:Uncharacterised protein [Mycobacteroides abscessus subsp. abscessus]|nr:Uncharacterised protein [Mycobacteroides abscessus subsp. abscessus]